MSIPSWDIWKNERQKPVSPTSFGPSENQVMARSNYLISMTHLGQPKSISLSALPVDRHLLTRTTPPLEYLVRDLSGWSELVREVGVSNGVRERDCQLRTGESRLAPWDSSDEHP